MLCSRSRFSLEDFEEVDQMKKGDTEWPVQLSCHAGPSFSGKDGPRPLAHRILVTSSRSRAPEIKQKGGQVDEWLVHNITSKACRKREDLRNFREDTRLPYTSIKLTLLVVLLAVRSNNVV